MSEAASLAGYETEREFDDESRNDVQSAEAVPVEIYDQVYHLRGTDAGYIETLAASVDAKMRAVAAHGGTVDSLRVAVLAALNITDELQALRAKYETLAGLLSQSQRTVRTRAGSLSHLLDEVIDEAAEGGMLGRKVG